MRWLADTDRAQIGSAAASGARGQRRQRRPRHGPDHVRGHRHQPATGHSEQDRLLVLAAIDRLPVGYRTELGRLLLDGLRAVHATQSDEIVWRFRTFRTTAPGEVQLGFGVCSQLTDVTREAFRSWFLLRRFQKVWNEPA
jgi:hypothetical protein